MKKSNQKSNRRVKNQQGRKYGCVIISILVVMILGACSLLEEKHDIVAEEITDEVEELDTVPIVLDDTEEQEGNQSEETHGAIGGGTYEYIPEGRYEKYFVLGMSEDSEEFQVYGVY